MIIKTKIIKISKRFVCGRFFLPKRITIGTPSAKYLTHCFIVGRFFLPKIITISTVCYTWKNGDEFYEITVVAGKSFMTSIRPPTYKVAMELHKGLYATSGDYSYKKLLG